MTKREMNVFQKSAHIAVDLFNKTAVIHRMEPETSNVDNQLVKINSVKPEIKAVNSIKQELEDFYNSTEQKLPVKVSLADAEAALLIAQEIDLQIGSLYK